MRVIPGSDHAKSCEYEPVDERKAVYFELSPNECSLHDSRLVHGAEADTSNRRRCGYTMRYFSQKMRDIADAPANRTHQLWHTQGRNPHNNPVRN